MSNVARLVAVAAMVLACAPGASAVEIETVTVGNQGNAGELSGAGAGGWGPSRTCGAVDYVYNIGKFEVTAGQYTEFLNAVAATDPYGLYNMNMWINTRGCKIERTGSSPNLSYNVTADWADRPVNYVSWGDAARFANWLQNARPKGTLTGDPKQDAGLTEEGSYSLSGAVTDPALIAVVREPDAVWAISSEDEWYKAAYYNGGTALYYDYPTGADSVPSNQMLDPDPGNNANYSDIDYTIGSPYYRTNVGEFENSASPYGTFDQGGNVWEWNETAIGPYRGIRGASFSNDYALLHAADRTHGHPTSEWRNTGFRLVEVLPDFDRDGVYDESDDCPNTPAGAAVDVEGRPLGDIDRDCDTDLEDYGLLQRGFTGPLAPPILMTLIPGGEFEMGDTFDEGESDELPVHTVYLSPYYIDTYKVTNQRYAAALNWAWVQGGLITVTSGVVRQAGSGTGYPYCSTTSAPTGYPHYGQFSRITWNGSTFGVTVDKEDYPMVMVNWYGAAAYANWRSAMEGKTLCYDLTTWECDFDTNGYRLPTEAEWEKAARGGVTGRRFPWSDTDTIQHARANYYSPWENGAPYYPYDTSPTEGYHPTFHTEEWPYTSPVGYFAPNGYAVHDMAGNVSEWCYDWYGSSYYSDPQATQPDPNGPGSGTGRVLRGGNWSDYPDLCRSAFRGWGLPYDRITVGFRCAVGTP